MFDGCTSLINLPLIVSPEYVMYMPTEVPREPEPIDGLLQQNPDPTTRHAFLTHVTDMLYGSDKI